MGKFIITEEEKRNILNQYQRFMLSEQENTTTTTTLQPTQQTPTTNQNINVSNAPLGTIKTTGLTMVPNLAGQQVTDKMGTRPQQPMTVQATTEYQKTEAEKDADYQKQQEMVSAAQKLSSEENISYDEAYERIKSGKTQAQGKTTYNTGVYFGQTSPTEVGAGIGRLLSLDNTDKNLFDIIKSPEDPKLSNLVVPAPEVAKGDDKVVQDYNKTVNDYLAKYKINLKLKWTPNEPNSETSMKYGKFYREEDTPTTAQQGAIAQTTTGAAQQGTATASTQQPVSNYTVNQLQDLLKQKGFNVGTSDGIVGKNTWTGIESALKKAKTG